MKKPAEQLVEEIGSWVKSARPDDESGIVPIKDLKRWLKLAKSIDGRMRLDGSPKNRRKKSSSFRGR